jgi:hypothetical protein
MIFLALKDQLKINPLQLSEPLRKSLYKIRMAITDKNTGKSAGSKINRLNID